MAINAVMLNDVSNESMTFSPSYDGVAHGIMINIMKMIGFKVIFSLLFF